MKNTLILVVMIATLDSNLFCIAEKASYKPLLQKNRTSSVEQKRRPLPPIPPQKPKPQESSASPKASSEVVFGAAARRQLPLNEIFGPKPPGTKKTEEVSDMQKSKDTQDTEVWKIAGESGDIGEKIKEKTSIKIDEQQTEPKQEPSLFERAKTRTRSIITEKKESIPESPSKKTTSTESIKKLSDGLKTFDATSREQLGEKINPNDFTDKEKQSVIEQGNKLLSIDEEDFKKLPPEDQLTAFITLRARVLQLQQADKIVAGIGESRKGIERQAGIESLIESERAKGTSEEQIKEMVATKKAEIREQEPFKSQLDKLDEDLKSLDEKYGYNPELQKDRLTKANDLFKGIDGIGGEITLRKNTLSSIETKLSSIPTRNLTDDQKKEKKEIGDDYCRNFAELSKKLPPDEQEALFKKSTPFLKKVRRTFVAEQKKQIKSLERDIADLSGKPKVSKPLSRRFKRDSGEFVTTRVDSAQQEQPNAAKIRELTRQLDDTKKTVQFITGQVE